LIVDTVQATPGASFRQIVRETGIPAGTARHHLSVLIRRRRVWYTRMGCRLAHFTGERPQSGMGVIRAVTATFDELDGRLYLAARDQGPLCQKDLVAVAPDVVPRSTVQHRIKRLVRLGILRETPMGRRCMYAVRWSD
jgi:predicted transcriptional regulator